MSSLPPLTLSDLQPLAYHGAVLDYLKEQEPEVWAWASSAEAEREYLEYMRTTLLKQCYRLDADGHGELIAQAGQVAQDLGIAPEITLYQASGDAPMNAALYYAPGQAHVVFTGPVLSRLQGAELDAVLAHELAHYRLWEHDARAHLIADRIMAAAANDPRASASHMHTAQRLRLYTEIYADRGALIGCGDLHTAVSALVKFETGLPQVSAASYLRQADEILASHERSRSSHSHPELFIRARALRLWSERAADLAAWLATEIEGDATLDSLCLVRQQQLKALTRRVLADFLRPAWTQTSGLLAHARAFFPDLKPAAASDASLGEAVRAHDAGIREYFSYVLLDFARADRELDELPLAHALAYSRALGVDEQFEKLAARELGLNKRQWTKLKKDAPAMLSKAEASA